VLLVPRTPRWRLAGQLSEGGAAFARGLSYRLNRYPAGPIGCPQVAAFLGRYLFSRSVFDRRSAGLLDESVRIRVRQGTRLFPDAGPDTALELVDSRSTPSGVIILVYRPSGRPQYGTATVDMNT
jgi:hypothetical protein